MTNIIAWRESPGLVTQTIPSLNGDEHFKERCCSPSASAQIHLPLTQRFTLGGEAGMSGIFDDKIIDF